MEEGWHSYWRNPGDAGSATIIEWDLPPGFAAGEIQWPYPYLIEQPPLASYGYGDEVLLLVDIDPPASLDNGMLVRLSAVADWVVCERICLPATAEVALDLPVSTSVASFDDRWRVRIEHTRDMLPVDVAEWGVSAWAAEKGFIFSLDPPSQWAGDLRGAHFYAADQAVIAHAASQSVTEDRGAYRLAVARSEFAAGDPERLKGVIVAPDGVTWEGTARALSIDVEVGSAPLQGGNGSGVFSLAIALLFAIIGGLLLNLMPCVFPVLSIKILGIIEQGAGDQREIRKHGVAFASGVMASFLVLAGMLLVVRAGGTQLGWGFQLQSPLFVAFLAGLFFVLGLNLLGVFQVGAALTRLGGRGQTRSYAGSFGSGVLATVVATPCIAPFMGAALGFALTQSAIITLLVFAVLGVGMALPYVMFSVAPKLLRRLPSPGPWTETLRQALAFPLFATAIWLAWVFGRQTGVDGISSLALALLLVGLGVWIVGRWNGMLVSRKAYVVTRLLATATVATAVLVAVAATRTSRRSSAPEGRWHEWSAAAVTRHRDSGRPVFVDFTADWCLTCKVNERVVLATSEIESAFEAAEVALLKADWTTRDPAITAALESFGAGGVPLYVLYPGDPSGNPRVLPIILTRKIVLDALRDVTTSQDHARAQGADR
jgi:thiol:disulfide interchange protein DsbD